MRKLWTAAAAAAAVLFTAGTAAATQDEVLRDGKDDYWAYCAACHGESGKGDGRMADILLVKPANLTDIAKRNGGVFPFWEVYGVIDGSIPVKGHFMPDWDARFRADEQKPGYARAYLRILALTHYLESIQEE